MRYQLRILVVSVLCAACVALPRAASASDSCESRYTELNIKYSTAYTNLGSECSATDVSSDNGAVVEPSPYCIEQYEKLANQMSNEYSALFDECATVLFPNPVEETPNPTPDPDPTQFVPEDPLPPIETPVVDPAPGSCDQRFIALNERFGAEYINLDAECYPKDGESWCGFQLSEECQEKYSALATESGNAYNALYSECYSADGVTTRVDAEPSFMSSQKIPSAEVRSIAPEVVAAPSKQELLSQIKSLKKQLRRSKASNKKMRARCRK